MRVSLGLIVCFALTACGGGGAGTHGGALPGGARPASVMLKFAVPNSGAMAALRHRRGTRSIAATSVALGISAVPVGSALPPDASPRAAFDVSAGSPNCVAQPDGSRSCTFTLALSPGNFVIAAGLWDAQAQGTPAAPSFAAAHELSRATLTQQFVAGANTVALAFDGVVNGVDVAAARLAIDASDTPQDVVVTAIARDADGNAIIGPEPYIDAAGNAGTMSLAMTRSAGLLTATSTNGTAPGVSTTLHYSGGPARGADVQATFTTSMPDALRQATATVAVRPALVEYALPAADPVAGHTYVDPSNVLWIAYRSLNAWKIAKMSAAGSVAQTFPVNFEPLGMATGKDGRLWFAGPGSVGALATTSGLESDFAIAGTAGSVAMTDAGMLYTVAYPSFTVYRIDTASPTPALIAGAPVSSSTTQATIAFDGRDLLVENGQDLRFFAINADGSMAQNVTDGYVRGGGGSAPAVIAGTTVPRTVLYPVGSSLLDVTNGETLCASSPYCNTGGTSAQLPVQIFAPNGGVQPSGSQSLAVTSTGYRAVAQLAASVLAIYDGRWSSFPMTSPSFSTLFNSPIQMTADGSVWYVETGTDASGTAAARVARFMF